MTTEINITKVNEAFVKVSSNDEGAIRTLHEHFSFKIPNAQFNPKVRQKIWDGKIKLLNYRNRHIYGGLVPEIEQICLDKKWNINSLTNNDSNFTLEDARTFFESLDIPEHIKQREYQLEYFSQAIRTNKQILLCPTGAGKSMLAYLIIRWCLANEYKKCLIIVPTVNLVLQMTTDFEDYGWDTSFIHQIYAGQDKNTDRPVTISTWQSLITQSPEYFEQFDSIIGDECLHPKTKITMEDLTYKNIEDINVGDIIKTYNEQLKIIENKEVLEVHNDISIMEDMLEIELENGNLLKITGNHKILLTSGIWKRADELQEGDILNTIE